jgi:mannose-6-phosphate isomerase
VEQAFDCIDFEQVEIGPVPQVVEETVPVFRQRLFHCEHFSVWRHRGHSAFTVGLANSPRVLVCLDGEGHVNHKGADYAVRKGDVLLLPAMVGACAFRPCGAVNLLEVAAPE